MMNFLAQAGQNPDMWQQIWTPMFQAGIGALLLGPMLYWFAIRAEKKLDRIAESLDSHTEAINRSTVANMVNVLNTSRLDEGLRAMTEKLKASSEEAIARSRNPK